MKTLLITVPVGFPNREEVNDIIEAYKIMVQGLIDNGRIGTFVSFPQDWSDDKIDIFLSSLMELRHTVSGLQISHVPPELTFEDFKKS